MAGVCGICLFPFNLFFPHSLSPLRFSIFTLPLILSPGLSTTDLRYLPFLAYGFFPLRFALSHFFLSYLRHLIPLIFS
ncbi:hypothetical protein F5X96DRAFT_658099 [Biscogniauxia mediterranea]|nr:hypothetical protein F5X96DRAFT_658099 [Biscogniauxia mediterranea]